MNYCNWVVIDPNHKWFGRKVKMIANSGRGELSGYLISYGAQQDWVTSEAIKKIDMGRIGRPKKIRE